MSSIQIDVTDTIFGKFGCVLRTIRVQGTHTDDVRRALVDMRKEIPPDTIVSGKEKA